MKHKKDTIKKANSKNKILIVSLLMLFLSILLLIVQKKPSIFGFATLSLQPSSQSVNTGAQLRLDIFVTQITNLAGVQLSVSYNPNVLVYDKVTEGTFLNQGGTAQTLFLNTINTSQPGLVKDIVIVKLGGGVSGSGLIASVYFNGTNSGFSDLQLQNVLLADTNNNQIATGVVNTNVSVIGQNQTQNQTNQTNNPPVVSPIVANLADVDPSTPGIQFYENTTVTYSASATDADNDPLSWIWLYSINNAPPVTFLIGTGAVQNAVFTYPLGTAGINYIWIIRVSDGKSTTQSTLNVGIIAKQCFDPDNDGYGTLCPLGAIDCDQSNPFINPGAPENCTSFADDNCNGLINCFDVTACSTNPACNTDSDGDGVPNGNDFCPFTPLGTKVNIYGCPEPVWNKFTPNLTTNFSAVDLRNFTDMMLGIQGLGQIHYPGKLMTLLQYNMTITTYMPINLNNIFDFYPHRVVVNPIFFPNLNTSAVIVLMNLINITNPRLLRDSIVCTDCVINGFVNKNLNFSVPHFTEYSVEEGSYCGDTFCSGDESCSNCSSDCGTCPSSGGGGSSSGGGGGGGGGGGSGGGGGGGAGIFFVCNQDWQCTEWSACVDGFQTRQCNFVKVPQHVQDTQCPTLSDAPTPSQQCTVQQQSIGTCNDSIQNQDETGVDCGGICVPCTTEQQPITPQEPAVQTPAETVPKTQKTISSLGRILTYTGILAALVIVIIFLIRRFKATELETTTIDRKSIPVQVATSYIITMRKKGFKDKEIAESLVQAGWKKEMVQQLIKK